MSAAVIIGADVEVGVEVPIWSWISTLSNARRISNASVRNGVSGAQNPIHIARKEPLERLAKKVSHSFIQRPELIERRRGDSDCFIEHDVCKFVSNNIGSG